MGHSFGGTVAVHAAVLFPDMVRGLVLSDCYFPGLRHLEPDLFNAHIWQTLADTLREAGIEIGSTVDFQRLFQAVRGFSAPQWQVIRERMGAVGAGWLSQAGRLAETTAAADAFAEAGLTADVIRSVRQPVAALYDEHSPLLATAAFLRENLPRCQVDTVPGAEHLACCRIPSSLRNWCSGIYGTWPA